MLPFIILFSESLLYFLLDRIVYILTELLSRAWPLHRDKLTVILGRIYLVLTVILFLVLVRYITGIDDNFSVDSVFILFNRASVIAWLDMIRINPRDWYTDL